MKIILTGSTGFIGREVLSQCLQSPEITSIVVLSRREIPVSATEHPKLQVVVLQDFLTYPESLNEEVQDAEACIWSLGRARIPDNDTALRVSIDFTLAGVRTFHKAFAAKCNDAKKFRFVYLSAAAAERDQTKSLWFMQDYRRIRGQVENELLAFAKENEHTFETYIMRPAMVLTKETTLRSLIVGMGPSVKVNILAKVMTDVAQNGSETFVFDNAAFF